MPGAPEWVAPDILAERVRAGEVTAEHLCETFLRRIEQYDLQVGAFLSVDRVRVLEQARAIDKTRSSGRTLGPLAGVPIALKDNLCTEDAPTTCASRILAGYRPPYDAHVVRRLREADAVILGKTNLDEFAMGSSTENSGLGVTRNPWDLACVPGGSSGGSAAAVAAGFAPGALGSDTGGSVRQPGALCGVMALKPTYGRVSRYGLVAFASSLDQVGPFALTSAGVARLLSVIAGRDMRDATSSDKPVDDYEHALHASSSHLRIGWVPGLETGADGEIVRQMNEVRRVFVSLGCAITQVDLPHAEHALSVYYLIANAEASSNLARFDGMRYGVRIEGEDLGATYSRTRANGFGAEVKRRIMLGTYALSAGYYDALYLRAQRVRTLICRDYEAAFQQCDLVLTPTTPTAAFRLGEKTSDPLSMYLADLYTLPASLAGIPAMSVPCGFTQAGLPVGVQLAAPAFEETRLLSAARALEEAGIHPHRVPTAVST